MIFYEIDPAVERLARNTEYFTYLSDSEARRVKLNVVLGDARLKLERAPDHQYGLIFIDAFSSHAIPIHLITREAIHLYLEKMSEDALLAFHISNPALRHESVLGALARDAGLIGLIRYDGADEKIGKAASVWVVMARQQADLGKLANDVRWKLLSGGADVAIWTDDYSNLLRIFKWR